MNKLYSDKVFALKRATDRLKPITEQDHDNDTEHDDLGPITEDPVSTTKKTESPVTNPQNTTTTDTAPKNETATNSPDKPKVEMTPFEKAMSDINSFAGIAADNKKKRERIGDANLPSLADVNKLDEKPSTEAATEGGAVASSAKTQESQPKTSGISIASLNTASADVKADPLAEAKQKAKEAGIALGLPLGTEVATGVKTSEQAQAECDKAIANQNAAATTAAPENTTSPAPETTTAPAPTTTSATSTPTAFPKEFGAGYLLGYNKGYAEGLEIARQKKAQDQANAKEKLKASEAYQKGYQAAMNKATNPSPEADAEVERLNAKYEAPAEAIRQQQAAAAKQSPSVAAAPTDAEKKILDDARAYTMGFNDAYAAGLGKNEQAKKDRIAQEKEHPDYKAGVELAKKAIEDPANANQYEAQANSTGNKLTQKGYLAGYNKAYAEKLGKENAAKKAARDPKAVAQGEYKQNYDDGVKAGEAGSGDEPKSINRTEGETDDQYNSRLKKAQAAFIMGYNQGLANKSKPAEDDPITGKKKDPRPVKLRHGLAVGEVIGTLEAQGGDAKIAENEHLRELLKGQPLPTPEGGETDASQVASDLVRLKAYLKGLKFVKDAPDKRPADLTEKERVGMDALAIKAHADAQFAYDEAQNMGTDADFEKGYEQGHLKGFNRAYAQKLAKSQSSNPTEEAPEFKQGQEDGLVVGELAAKTRAKGGSPEQQQAFNMELQNTMNDAQAKGKTYYAGFLRGYNAAYGTVLGGGTVAKKEALPNSIQAIIAAYEKAGDSDMVELIQKKYDSVHAETYKEIYEQLTGPYNPENKSEEKFVTIPSTSELALKQTEAERSQHSSIKDSYKAELDQTEKRLKVAEQEGDEATQNKLNDIKAAVDKEIEVLSLVAKKAYEVANTAAQNDGYSFIWGFNEKINPEANKPRDPDSNDNSFKAPAPASVNAAEVKKGSKAAEKYGSAMRINAALAKDGYKAGKGLTMPPIVVSTAYKQGHTEASQKWRIVKLVSTGIPIPVKLRDSDMYKAYNTQEEATLPITEVELKSADATDQKPTEKPETTSPKELPKALTRATYGEAGARFEIPKTSQKANELLQASGQIAGTDVQFFKAELVGSFYEKVLEVKKAREAETKGQVQLDFEKAQKEFSAATKDNVGNLSANYFKRLAAYMEKLIANKAELAPLKTAADAGIATAKQELAKPLDDAKLTTIRSALDKAIQPIVSPADDAVTLMKSKHLDGRQTELNKLITEVYGAEAGAEQAKINSAIEKATEDFSGGYFSVLALYEDTEDGEAARAALDEDDDNSFEKNLKQYAEEIGYADGFAQKIAALGLERTNPAKAVKIINKFAQETQANIPVETKQHLIDLKGYTDAKEVEIKCTEEAQKYLDEKAILKDLYNAALAQSKSLGEADAIAAFNLSSDEFAFVSGTRYRKENSNEVLPIGPLGTLADKYFKKLLDLAQGLKISGDIESKIGYIFENTKKNTLKSGDNKLTEFKNATFGQNAQVSEQFLASKLIFTPQKAVAHQAEDRLFELNIAPKSEAVIDANKLLFKLGNESTTPKGNDKITLISDKNQQITISGSGMNMYKGKEPTALFAPKVIIPSLQKQLIAEDPKDKTKKVSVDGSFVTPHLTIGEGAIRLDRESIKNTFTQLRNNLISALNTKEEADYKKSDTPKIAPNAPK